MKASEDRVAALNVAREKDAHTNSELQVRLSEKGKDLAVAKDSIADLELKLSTLTTTLDGAGKRETDLKEQAVAAVNERAEERADAFAQPPAADLPETGTAAEENLVDYGAGALPEEKPRKKFLDGRLLIAEFAAVLGLVALILLTNIFWEEIGRAHV